MTSLSAPCNTIRRGKTLHLDRGRMAVMVWSGSAAHPSNCTRLWCSKVPAQHSQDLPWEAEVRCPGPHHRKTDALEGLRQVQDQGQGSLIFCPCSVFEHLHLPQNIPDCLLSSSISAISSVPINAVLLVSHSPPYVLSRRPTNESTLAWAQSVSHS